MPGVLHSLDRLPVAEQLACILKAAAVAIECGDAFDVGIWLQACAGTGFTFPTWVIYIYICVCVCV